MDIAQCTRLVSVSHGNGSMVAVLVVVLSPQSVNQCAEMGAGRSSLDEDSVVYNLCQTNRPSVRQCLNGTAKVTPVWPQKQTTLEDAVSS